MLSSCYQVLRSQYPKQLKAEIHIFLPMFIASLFTKPRDGNETTQSQAVPRNPKHAICMHQRKNWCAEREITNDTLK